MKLGRLALTLSCVAAASLPAGAQQGFDYRRDWDRRLPSTIGCGRLSTLPPGTTLRGSFVYIYSFLDLRTKDAGPRITAAIHQQVVASFAEAGIAYKLQLSGQNPATRYSVLADGSKQVWVDNAIRSNAVDETATKARYRLIVFPEMVSEDYLGKDVEVCWSLLDVATGKQIWSFRTVDSRGMFGKGGDARGRAVVLRLMDELKTDGLL